MNEQKSGLNTICTHVGEVKDEQFKGAISPLYMSTSYAFEDVDLKRYPRYFNTPNQEALCRKIAALEHTGAALIFGSGMAAISTALLAFLKAGDHIVLQRTLYGGTYNLVTEEFDKFGIEFSFTDGWTVADFEDKIKENTKVIYIETPSNPLLTITDLAGIEKLSKKHGLVSMIDNTFASPINQNPHLLGIDIVLHSATKYLGGHSDITAGVAVGSTEHIKQVLAKARHLGGSCEAQTAALLERSIKTLALRVRQQNENAQAMAEWLESRQEIGKVYYPGLMSHPQHELAKRQMHGFGGMLSFDLANGIDPVAFQQNLKLIASAMSLGGVDSSVCSAYLTSHRTISAERRAAEGISDQLIRMSMGIEDVRDLQTDLTQAFALRTSDYQL